MYNKITNVYSLCMALLVKKANTYLGLEDIMDDKNEKDKAGKIDKSLSNLYFIIFIIFLISYPFVIFYMFIGLIFIGAPAVFEIIAIIIVHFIYFLPVLLQKSVNKIIYSDEKCIIFILFVIVMIIYIFCKINIYMGH